MASWAYGIPVILLTLLSGIGDALGFIHASRVWTEEGLDWIELAKSALGFGFGIAAYWVALRFIRLLGVVSPEVQSLLWFSVTLVGIALLSGQFFRWRVFDQAVGAIVFLGIAWLIIRTGG